MSDYLTGLNPEQRKAVEHFEGPILVLAGAGSGKTRVLTHRVVHLVQHHHVRPGSILAVTFTNKATQEMKERLENLLGPAAKHLWVSTFHSTCLRILRFHADKLNYHRDFIVYDDKETQSVLKQIIKELNIDEKRFELRMFQSSIDSAKNEGITAEAYAKQAAGYQQHLVADVYDRYQKELRAANAMDFGDLLLNAVLLLKYNPEVLALYQRTFRFVLVDEFQDTNKIQYDFVKLMIGEHRNLLVVGDDDQSIYAFRGADVRNILNFEKDFKEAKVVTLEQNYRSTQSILEVAHSVISKNKNRKPKKLWTESGKGNPIVTYVAENEEDEANFIANEIKQLIKDKAAGYADIAIFYRTNAQSRALEEALMFNKVPYRIFGGLKFYERKEIKDIVCYLRLILSSRDNQAFLRILNTPTRGIGAKALDDIVLRAKAMAAPLWEGAQSYASDSKPVAQFVALIEELRTASETLALPELIGLILEKTGYLERLKPKDKRDHAAESRIENVRELQASALGYAIEEESTLDTLRRFLDHIALASSAENPSDQPEENQGLVSLMTLHLAKGLEFPYVFFSGLEEGLCPHQRTLFDPVEIEEERRLCYVGVTRARQQLYLIRARSRTIFNSGSSFGAGGQYREPSRFAFDMPGEFLQGRNGSFLDTVFMEPEEEDDTEFLPSFFNKSAGLKSKTKKPPADKLAYAKSLVFSAEQLSGVPVQKKLPSAPLEQITQGVEVCHPVFGAGTVISIEPGKSGELAKGKVAVQFKNDAVTRTLVLGKANLALL